MQLTQTEVEYHSSTPLAGEPVAAPEGR